MQNRIGSNRTTEGGQSYGSEASVILTTEGTERQPKGAAYVKSSASGTTAVEQEPLGAGLGARLRSHLRNIAWATGRGGHTLYDPQPDLWLCRCRSEDEWDARWKTNFSPRHMEDNKGLVSHCTTVPRNVVLAPLESRTRPSRHNGCWNAAVLEGRNQILCN